MNRSKLKILIPLSLFFLAPLISHAQMREWTDEKGRKVEAEFLGTEGAGATVQVKLKTPAGKVLTFPVANLSEKDRIFVKSSLPTDPQALASEIDKLVLNKMKVSFRALKEELANLPAETGLTPDQRAKRKADILRELEMCVPNEKTNDEQFMRRIYLDLAGRIPTFEEASSFLDSADRGKRAKLIDELLESEAFPMRMYNFFSDLLRVREGVEMMGNDLKADPYIEWVKLCMDEDKPYDKMVQEILTATGHIWDNPATGYMITDTGMRMCNLSNTFTIFMGTEITCAQCHDHPFESVKQLDFYRMASFIGETETRSRRGSAPKGSGPKGGTQSELQRMSKILDDAGKLREGRDVDRTLQEIFSTFQFYVHDTGNQKVALPHDYKYDNGAPRQKVQPIPYIGDDVDLAKHKTKREAFAEWVTSEGNPRFTINIVNRLWKMAFGLGQIEPVYNIPGHMDDQAQNYELLVFLEKMMQDLDYSLKDFLRVIYNTETYQREAETLTPTLTQVDNGTYHFPGPILRRMSAEQLWDSLVTLTTADPEGFKRRGWEEYREVMKVDTTQLTTVEDIEAFKARYNSIGGLMSNSEEMMGRNAARVGGQQMVRASELRQPMAAGHFLRMFGQSDKQLIENQFTTGSTPQVMALLNGVITNQVLTNPDAYLINEIVNGDGNKRDKVGKIFLSVLGREPTTKEKSKAYSGMRARIPRDATDRNRQMAENAAIGNVIWALVNTREFMFVQ